MLNLPKYRIIEKLGEGGMGEVYRAEDLVLGRTVAIKTISLRGREGDQAEARFLREARTASACNHPNIAVIYELGQTDELSYIVMEFVEGQNLRYRLKHGTIDTASILDLAIQVCGALEAAHSRGVIHRDIKPENILITHSGLVKVVDFGLAKWVSSPNTVSRENAWMENLTQSGVLMGTPAYMSPEQIKGEEPDARADIFSLGIVMHEMMTGKLPFTGANALEVAASILRDRAVRIDSGSSSTTEELGKIVDRCLEKDRNKRYAGIAELRKELQRVQQERGISNSMDTRDFSVQTDASSREAVTASTILVSPLQFIGQAGESDYIPLVLTQALITDLSRIPGVSVLSASSSGRSRDLAREQGANILLEGEIVRAGDKIGVMARLTDVASGRVLWGGQHRADASDLFAIQDAVCRNIADALQITVTAEVRKQISRPATSNVDAFHHYAQGKSLLERHDKKENLTSAIHLFEEALKLDPQFALAYAGLGEAYCQKYRDDHESGWMKRAVEACDHALILDPGQAQVHISLGMLYHGTGKIDRAIEEFQRAITLQPGSDEAYQWLGRCYVRNGDLEQAVSFFEKAISIRPYWDHYLQLGVCYYTFGKYHEAIEQFRRVISMQPDNYRGYNNLGVMYYMLGECRNSAEILRRATEIYPNQESFTNLGTAYFYLEEYQDATRAFQEAIRLDPRNDVCHRNLGDAYSRTGKPNEARKEYIVACDLLKELLRIDPADGLTLGRLAICQAKSGDIVESLANVERAAALAPSNNTIMYYQSVVLALAGDPDRAVKALGMALDHGHSSSEVLLDPDLASLRDRSDYQALFSKGN